MKIIILTKSSIKIEKEKIISLFNLLKHSKYQIEFLENNSSEMKLFNFQESNNEDDMNNINKYENNISNKLEIVSDNNLSKDLLIDNKEYIIQEFKQINNDKIIKNNQLFNLFTILIIIEKIELNKFSININQLDLKYIVEYKNITTNIIKIISNILNYTQCKLSGLTIKDENTSKKIKPIIDIYIKKNIIFDIPTEFYFCKENLNLNKNSIYNKFPFVSSSKILNNLLNKLSLTFTFKNEKKCILVKKKNSFFVEIYNLKPISFLDAIFGHSAQIELMKVLDSYKASFTALLHKILYKSNKKNEIKVFFKIIKNRLSDIEYAYLCDIVTNSPLFLDSRDLFIDRLEKFLNTSEILENVEKKVDYLEIKRIKIIKKSSNIGIKKLIE